ncbi:MAG: tRNA (N6-isopentenyl adenosine(37)-C2)-methylthiotransferase MiaB [Rhodobacteraceae bacterium]|nr:tRNA (N6-isopentenyl adenosine(37)-C2)-methylthiotransferase MiaB [Paracoccaceae bacterium]MCY4249678.1 tRNA (N6-isopentenyl adenosine(37)-C2)-methylthiotransferase MiaB [Paracoccaceae bacterium]
MLNQTPKEKKVFIKSFGCQMNVYDSERMAEALIPLGYKSTPREEDADLIILNTCHIREKATEKIYSEVGRLKPIKQKNPDLKITVAGCVAQAEGKEIIRRQPMVDILVGPQAYHKLPELIKNYDKKPVALELDQNGKFDWSHRGKPNAVKVSSFLTVQEGCDKFCTFCVVPYTRGKEYSRPVAEIINEARELIGSGARELVLLGQNVNAYHGLGQDNRNWSLADLIWKISELPDLQRIRFVTSHPNEMTLDLMTAFRDCPKLMPYLHLPIQSGSDRILQLMNRKHTQAEYVEIISRLREYRPDIAISGDFIVGFPEETEEDFQETLNVVKKVGFIKSFSFKYSPRPGTPAAERVQVDSDTQSERLHRLQNLLSEYQFTEQRNMVGNHCQVLFEREGRLEGQLVGKSEHFQVVFGHVPVSWIGKVGTMKIVDANVNSLQGELVN